MELKCEDCDAVFQTPANLALHKSRKHRCCGYMPDEVAITAIKTFMRLQLDHLLTEKEWQALGLAIGKALTDEQQPLIQPAIQEVLEQRKEAKP